MLRNNHNYVYTLNTVKDWITIVLLLSFIAEMCFFPTTETFYGCISLLYGWILISFFVLKHKNIRYYPLPTIAMFGYGISFCFLPLVITLIEGKPLNYNFDLSYLTFTNQIFIVTILVLSYLTSIKLYHPKNILNRALNYVGFMKTPSELVVWIMGFLGISALIITILSKGDSVYTYDYNSTGNGFAIILNSLSKLSLVPICLYFKDLYGDSTKCRSKYLVKYYILFIMIIGVSTTQRTLIFNSIVTIGCIYFFIILYRNRKLFKKKYIVSSIVLVYLVTGPIADLAMAMIIVRQTYNMSASKSLSSIMSVYSDKEQLHTLYQLAIAATDNGGDSDLGWSDYYTNNIFLERFCNLRTVDVTLYNAEKMGYGCEEGKKYYINFWVNELPGPLVGAMGLKKDFLGTAVDHMVVDNFGDQKYSLFGNKVGGETGIGLWVFGYWYYIVAFITYIVVFYFMCSLVNTSKNSLIIPIPVLINFWLYWMFFINANGIFTSMSYTFARGNLNKIAVYCLLLFILCLIFPLKNKVHENRI